MSQSHGLRSPVRVIAVSACLAAASYAGTVSSQDLALVNLQPLAEEVQFGAPFPSFDNASVYLEPVMHADGQQLFEAVIDAEVMNVGANYLWLEALKAWASPDPADVVSIAGQELLALDDGKLSVNINDDLRRRPMLADGGFAVSGLKLEMRVDKDEPLPYGEALAVTSLELDSGSGYLVSGSQRQTADYIPQFPDDDSPDTYPRGFVAVYAASGGLRTALVTDHAEVSAVADLADGRFVLAGVYSGAHLGAGGLPSVQINLPRRLLVTRVRAWETTDGGTTQRLGEIAVDEKFSDPDTLNGVTKSGTLVSFSDGKIACDVVRARSAAAARNGDLYVVAAHLRCGDFDRIGLVALDSDGTLHKDFGTDGTLVMAGPEGKEMFPVGVMAAYPSASWLWLGAAHGNDCSDNSADDCQFALTRIKATTGALDNFGFGWRLAKLPMYADAAVPHDMTLTARGRPVMAGAMWIFNSTRRIGVHKFTQTSKPDLLFGDAGWAVHQFDGHDAESRSVVMTSDGGIALGVMSIEPTDDGWDGSLAMMKLFDNGDLSWIHSPYAAGSYFTHMDVDDSLNYGYVYENGISSFPSAGLVEDWDERLVMVGWGTSGLETSPCTKSAETLGLPPGYFDCGGPRHIAVTRYLPFGKPDSRRWLAPGEARRIVMPLDHGPTSPSIKFHFGLEMTQGNDTNWWYSSHPVDVFSNAIDDLETSSTGSYNFPFAPGLLNSGERFSVKAHVLDHHHRHSENNRFAYDIHVRRHNGDKWVKTQAGADLKDETNKDHLIWQLPVRAVASGYVVACRRSEPDTAPGEYASDANFVRIQHTFDGFDATRNESISYVHFAQDSIPEALCPKVCPSDESCDPDSDGVDPDGAKLAEPVPVKAGDLIGRVGNSGRTGTPHLHIHLTTEANPPGDPASGSYPLLFNHVVLESMASPPGGPETLLGETGYAIAHETLVRPYE